MRMWPSVTRILLHHKFLFNFFCFYSWVCKSIPSFYHNSAPHNNVLQAQTPLSRVLSYFCSFTGLRKSHPQHWQRTVCRRQDLPLQSCWTNELWRQHASYVAPTSFPTLQNPFTWPTRADACLQPPEHSGWGLREGESTAGCWEWSWEGAANSKRELHGDRPWKKSFIWATPNFPMASQENEG